MRDFFYENPTRIHFGKGKIAELAREVPASARVALLAGGGSIRRNGVHDQVKEALGDRIVTEIWDIEPNPDVRTVSRALEQIRAQRADFLLAVGGGSVIDAAKAVAGLALCEGEPWEVLSKGARFTAALPLGVVLTLPGTGSEANQAAAISNRALHRKIVFINRHCFPRFAVLDPLSTSSLPPQQVANGVVDAYVHVLEQYLTFPVGGALQDRLAEAILATLLEFGPQVLKSPEDYEARANVMWSATLALNGLIGVGVPQDWTTHNLGHELTALHGLDHARSLAVVLPAVLEARREQKQQKLLQYGARIFGLTEGEPAARVSGAIARTAAFFESLGVPTRLSAYQLGEEIISPVIEQLKAARRVRMGERLDVTLEQARAILVRAL
jgi:NADP-dependent alcohol dehydrogenase